MAFVIGNSSFMLEAFKYTDDLTFHLFNITMMTKPFCVIPCRTTECRLPFAANYTARTADYTARTADYTARTANYTARTAGLYGPYC